MTLKRPLNWFLGGLLNAIFGDAPGLIIPASRYTTEPSPGERRPV